jgi:hypothetical protein
VDAAWRAGTRKREGGRACRGTTRAAQCDHVVQPVEQGRGKGLTDGSRTQCRVVAPADRRARAAQCLVA